MIKIIYIRKNISILIIFLGLLHISLFAESYADIVVDWQGNGDYETISEAIDALPMYPYQRTIIFIKNGIYQEKLRIEQNYITLKGESRDSTIIKYSQLREDWIRNKDYIGPAVINIEGDDIIFDNLTIENSQSKIGPHAFAIYGVKANRVIIINCNVISKGGDTVSLWNYKKGMYYHSNCYFEGAVDFVCPRGWCYIKDSEFYEVKETAAIWHAGDYNSDQKFVLQNCSFDGVNGFELGRHHYEAQFYLLNCKFSENMADRNIYKVYDKNENKNNPYYEGERKFYYNCTKDGMPFEWYKNNLGQTPGNTNVDEINPCWAFQGRWDPESNSTVHVIGYQIDGNFLILRFDEIVTVRNIPVFKNKNGKIFKIKLQRFTDNDRLTFIATDKITEDDIVSEMKLVKGSIIASKAYVQERSLGPRFTIIDED